jgi:predicted short-subunit dehydrogenase-like oxidoreductase (DUF2520 family)
VNVVFVGAGRLATQFAKALYAKGDTIAAVYSRTMDSATTLSSVVGGFATDTIANLPLDADAYIIAVKDAVLPAVIAQLKEGRAECPMFHTAGSVPMSVFEGIRHYGVIYPMQTFSKERDVDFSHLPFFIEANDRHALQVATELATSVSDNVRELSSEERRYLHLAAVFACNFSNHCYSLAADILERRGVPFDVLLPLIDETTQKVHTLHPREAQTGPAVRYDENVINAQLQLLADDPLMQQVYDLMSHSIHDSSSHPSPLTSK